MVFTRKNKVCIFLLSIKQLLHSVRGMKAIAVLMLFSASLAIGTIAGAAVPATKPTETQTGKSSLSYTDSVILGLVEGVTEYLPVSSTGHLILTNALLGLDGTTPALKNNGESIIIKDDETTRPYTIGDAAYAYVIVIQAGAIAAVALLYWRTILALIMGCLGRNPDGLKLAINLIAAFIPAAIIGLALDDVIESLLGDNVHAVAGALIVGAIVMLVVERWRKHDRKERVAPDNGPQLHELPISKAIMIGFFQCFAMWPGTSRSMATIVGGYLAGLSPPRAAEFSFLLGLITLTAASGYKFVSDGGRMLEALSVGPVLVGCIVAFISAALAVKWLVGYLSKHGLTLFAWYRIVLAILVLITVS